MKQTSRATPKSPSGPGRPTPTLTLSHACTALQHLQHHVQEVVAMRRILEERHAELIAHEAVSPDATPIVQRQMVDLITRSLVISLSHQLQARLTVERKSLRQVVPELLDHHKDLIYRTLKDAGIKIHAWKPKKRPSYADLQEFVKIVSHIEFPGKGLLSTLTPTLTYLDTGIRPKGGMDTGYVDEILNALGEPGVLEVMYPAFVHEQMSNDLKQIALTATSDESGRLPASYRGRYHLPAYEQVMSVRSFSDQRTSIRFSEAERMHLAQILNGIIPNHPTMGGVLYRLLNQIGSLWPRRSSLPTIDDAQFLRLVTIWRRTALMPLTKAPVIPQPGDASWPLFLAPSGDLMMIAETFQRTAPSELSLAEAKSITAAWYAEEDRHGMQVTLGFDEVNLVAEAVLGSLLRPNLPLSEVLLTVNILSKTGLPWLPPASPPLALHEPSVAVHILLGAAQLLTVDRRKSRSRNAVSP